jgi:DNA-binding XRE family transcriptional regulator
MSATPATDAARELVLRAEARDAAISGRGARVRRSLGLSQSEVARAIGVSSACVCRWEGGNRAPQGDAATRYGALLRELVNSLSDTTASSADRRCTKTPRGHP